MYLARRKSSCISRTGIGCTDQCLLFGIVVTCMVAWYYLRTRPVPTYRQRQATKEWNGDGRKAGGGVQNPVLRTVGG